MTTPTRRRGRTLRQRILALIRDAVERLTRAWHILTTAQTRLLNALAAIRPGRGAIARIRAATGVFQRSMAAFDQAVAGFAERWAATDLPQAYREGALAMLDHADWPHHVWAWTGRHQETITSLTAQWWADLQARLREALRRARAFLRAATDTARRVAAGRGSFDPQQLAEQHPLGTVIYANQARHPVQAWAEAALHGQAVTTANVGGIRTALDDMGVQWLEVLDGSGCGWRDHNDPDRANGSLRTVHDALANPIAHPRCIREFTPRMPAGIRIIAGVAA